MDRVSIVVSQDGQRDKVQSCYFCNYQDHKSFKCTLVTEPESRRENLWRKGRCFVLSGYPHERISFFHTCAMLAWGGGELQGRGGRSSHSLPLLLIFRISHLLAVSIPFACFFRNATQATVGALSNTTITEHE